MEIEKIDLVLERLEKLEKKIEDNNNILHGERNSKRWGKLFSIIKWIIIIAVGIVSWSYINEKYTSMTNSLDSAAETINSIKNIGDKIPTSEDISWENIKKKITD